MSKACLTFLLAIGFPRCPLCQTELAAFAARAEGRTPRFDGVTFADIVRSYYASAQAQDDFLGKQSPAEILAAAARSQTSEGAREAREGRGELYSAPGSRERKIIPDRNTTPAKLESMRPVVVNSGAPSDTAALRAWARARYPLGKVVTNAATGMV